jgi:hypothetical protein
MNVLSKKVAGKSSACSVDGLYMHSWSGKGRHIHLLFHKDDQL